MGLKQLDSESRQLYSLLAKIAVPIALQSLIGSSLNLVDNLMVGSLGEKELAAVGVGVQIYFIFWMIVYGFSSGCSTFMAQFWGARDIRGIRKTIGFTLMVSMSVGLLFFAGGMFFPDKIIRIFTDIPDIVRLGSIYVKAGALCFIFIALNTAFELAFRATQQTHIPMIASIIAFATNTFLNYILIFGNFGAPRLGVAGAAIATVFSRFIQTCILMFIVFGRKNIIAGSLSSYFGWTKIFVLRVVKNSIPTTINETMWGIGTAMYVAAFARIGVTEYASVQAGNTIQNLLQMAAFSIGDAILIMVGQKLGEGEKERAYSMAGRLLRIGTVIGGIFGLLLIAIARPVISMFNFTAAGEKYTFYILIVYGLTMWLVVFNGMVVTGVLRCGGDTRFSMFTETGTVWCIAVPLAFITALLLHWPVYFCILAIKSEELVKACILFWRYKSKKWVRDMVSGIRTDA